MTKNRKALAVCSTDWHLNSSNINQIIELVHGQCKLAVSLGVNKLFFLGDLFCTRVGQPVDVLDAVNDILDIIHSYQLEIWMIPGNHDKQNYSSTRSFLLPFKHHPALQLVNITGGVPFKEDGVIVHLLPYFEEKKWWEEYNELIDYIGSDDQLKHVLLSHQAVNGSMNNDGTKVQNGISCTDFKRFDLVLLGHYHNYQQVSPTVFHIPSIQQNNFGEDMNKGYTVLYNDLTFNIVRSVFQTFEKITIDTDKITDEDLSQLISTHMNSEERICFEFVTDKVSAQAIDKEFYTNAGIEVRIKIKEVEGSIDYAQDEVKEYNKDSIIQEFEVFCNEKNYNYQEGVTYLKNKLNGK